MWAPSVAICAVVKCDAYGHGAQECALALEQEGAKWFGVTSTDEGVILREAGVTGRVLVMCGVYRGEEEDALRLSLTPAVFRLQDAEALAQAAARQRLDFAGCDPSEDRYRHGASGTSSG